MFDLVSEGTILTYETFKDVENQIENLNSVDFSKIEEILTKNFIDFEITDTNGTDIGGKINIYPVGDVVKFRHCVTIPNMMVYFLMVPKDEIETKRTILKLAQTISLILIHETVHLEQYKRLPPEKQNPDFLISLAPIVLSTEEKQKMKDYLSLDREVMAFAKTIQEEIYRALKQNKIKVSDIKQMIQTSDNEKLKEISKTYESYMKHFKKSDKPRQLLNKHLYNYINGLFDREGFFKF